MNADNNHQLMCLKDLQIFLPHMPTHKFYLQRTVFYKMFTKISELRH
jgi:hypothetical protein